MWRIWPSTDTSLIETKRQRDQRVIAGLQGKAPVEIMSQLSHIHSRGKEIIAVIKHLKKQYTARFFVSPWCPLLSRFQDNAENQTVGARNKREWHLMDPYGFLRVTSGKRFCNSSAPWLLRCLAQHRNQCIWKLYTCLQFLERPQENKKQSKIPVTSQRIQLW